MPGPLVFYDDGQAQFSPDGGYAYTLSDINGGATSFGTYQLSDDGVVCVTYENGLSRCDLYVKSGDRLVVITQEGGRFPVRP